MKSKKAIKRLTRVEKLLAEVQSHYSALEKPLGKLLSSAKASVEGIKDSIAKSIKAKPAKASKSKKNKSGKKKDVSAKAHSKATPVVAHKRPAKRAASRTRKSSSAKRPASATSDAGLDAFTIAS